MQTGVRHDEGGIEMFRTASRLAIVALLALIVVLLLTDPEDRVPLLVRLAVAALRLVGWASQKLIELLERP